MKLGKNRMAAAIIAWLFIPIMVWSATQIGYVNVTQVFESSAFIKDTSKKMQADITNMNLQLENQKKKLKTLIEQYQAAKDAVAKTALESPLKTEELVLKNLTSSFQEKIRQDEIAGKQHFDTLLRAATERVAKVKHINVVVTEQNVLYSDKSWVDLTADVKRLL